jgi:hypothetical protein
LGFPVKLLGQLENYGSTRCEFQVGTPQRAGFIKRYNPTYWTAKRKTPTGHGAVGHVAVEQEYVETGFHFDRLPPKELLLAGPVAAAAAAAAASDGDAAGCLEELDHVVAVNISPMFPHHSLLIPHWRKKLPQVG